MKTSRNRIRAVWYIDKWRVGELYDPEICGWGGRCELMAKKLPIPTRIHCSKREGLFCLCIIQNEQIIRYETGRRREKKKNGKVKKKLQSPIPMRTSATSHAFTYVRPIISLP